MELGMENENKDFDVNAWSKIFEEMEKDQQLALKKEIKKGKKLEPIEYFYYLLTKLYKTKNIIKKFEQSNEKDIELASDSYELIYCLRSELLKIKVDILNIYELSNFIEYSKTDKATILNNPNLFGISPFLFEISTREWFNFIENDIKNYGKFNLNLIEKKISSILKNTLNRIGASAFPTHHRYDWASEEIESEYIYSNLVEDLFEAYEDRILDDFEKIEDNENRKFLKFFKSKELIKLKIHIDLPFDLADKIFKKYFEINFTKDRCDKIYSGFRKFLIVICNNTLTETEIKKIDLTEEEIKKMIGFFSCYKETDLSPNIFNYTVPKLVDLMELISGLPQKTTWEKAHRENKYKIDKSLKTKIDSIIPNDSALIK